MQTINQRPIPTLLACLTAACTAFGINATARADTLYKCMDESGVVLYTNQKGSAKNCTILSRDLPITSLTPPPPRSAQRNAPTPANFPRVDSDTQRGRDTDRRKILEQEFTTEQQNLDRARKALAEGEATRLGDEKGYQKYLGWNWFGCKSLRCKNR